MTKSKFMAAKMRIARRIKAGKLPVPPVNQAQVRRYNKLAQQEAEQDEEQRRRRA